MQPCSVVYSPKQVANIESYSPSAKKPRIMADILQSKGFELAEPEPLSVDDFKKVHHADYVDGIFNKTIKNGFGIVSDEVNASLPWTSGALYTACKLATPNKPACALASGFHHAGYAGWKGLGHFCTFNGLVAAARRLVDEGMKKVAILDCDMHWGNGTDEIIQFIDPHNHWVMNASLGNHFTNPSHAGMYLATLDPDHGYFTHDIKRFNPSLIIYQSGADVHVNDPQGGVLNTAEMIERDIRVFEFAKKNKIPIAWCLAGGYQVDRDGSIDKVIQLHLNTFMACAEVYGERLTTEEFFGS